MTIEQHAAALQKLMDEKLEVFTVMGKKAKELRKKVDTIHLQMGKIIEELAPVDSLLRAQHPDMCNLFDQLKKLVKENK